jgi:hypothetical protein
MASREFPPVISPAIIRSSVDSFRRSLLQRSERKVCSSCGVFCSISDIKTLRDDDNSLSDLNGLDRCGYEDGYWAF